MIHNDTAILIFSKTPKPGTVKTRLISSIGENRATELYCELIKKTISVVLDSGKPVIQIWSTPDITDPFICSIAEKAGAEIRLQYGENLGERMFNAVQDVYANFKEVIVIGCDCPVLSVIDLVTTVKKLRSGMDYVIGPSDDGGYYLLGCKQPYKELFTDIKWGGDKVLSTTLCKINKLHLRYALLEEKWDLDTAEDMFRYEALN